MLNQHEYTSLMDEAVRDATFLGKRFPRKVGKYCSHCGEILSLFGRHTKDSKWDDALCWSIIDPYADTLQMIYENPDPFKPKRKNKGMDTISLMQFGFMQSR